MRYELLLSGRGGYEGLSAMLSLVSGRSYNTHEAEGVIFPGELPPQPAFDGTEPPFEPADRTEIDPTEFAGYEGTATSSNAGAIFVVLNDASDRQRNGLSVEKVANMAGGLLRWRAQRLPTEGAED